MVTDLAIPERSMEASSPELPPPITAISIFLKNGPSQCGQKATPLPIFSSSPGILSFRHWAPVAIINDWLSIISPDDKVTFFKPKFWILITERFSRTLMP